MWGTSRKRWNPEQADASPLSSKQILSTLQPEDSNGGPAPPLNPTLNPDFNLNSSFPPGLLVGEYESKANRWVVKHWRWDLCIVSTSLSCVERAVPTRLHLLSRDNMKNTVMCFFMRCQVQTGGGEIAGSDWAAVGARRPWVSACKCNYCPRTPC